jgi:hypothetical protein
MALGPEQLEQFQAWHAHHQPNGCPVCAAKSWSVPQMLGMPTFVEKKTRHPIIPMIRIVCANCAHVELFAAAVIGIPS